MVWIKDWIKVLLQPVWRSWYLIILTTSIALKISEIQWWIQLFNQESSPRQLLKSLPTWFGFPKDNSEETTHSKPCSHHSGSRWVYTGLRSDWHHTPEHLPQLVHVLLPSLVSSHLLLLISVLLRVIKSDIFFLTLVSFLTLTLLDWVL